ncbi:MAG: hypothetical protein RI973_1713 [Bacteroidota bacterium]|jgi:uncharacterized protein YecE (DUF72 family)
MEFGKLQDLSRVDFTLPPEPPDNALILGREAGAPPLAFIGATGWSVPEWRGKVYPQGARPDSFLYHFGRQFNSIELNTTHYRIPDQETIEKWHSQTPADFRFCPKVLQRISHAALLGTDSPAGLALIDNFCQSLSGLGEKLGPCFLQLPPYFDPGRLPVLEKFLQHFSLPLALEVRHEHWFSDAGYRKQLFGLLAHYGASTVITDVAGRRDVCHMHLTTGEVLIRFVGNDLHPSDYSRLEDWAARLKHWFEQGLQAAYFFTHEPDNLLAPDLAAHLHQLLKVQTSATVRGPRIISEREEGGQLSLF